MHKSVFYDKTVRRFDELSGEFALKQCQSDVTCKQYIPDEWFVPDAKYSRDFCWGILATVQPDFTA